MKTNLPLHYIVLLLFVLGAGLVQCACSRSARPTSSHTETATALDETTLDTVAMALPVPMPDYRDSTSPVDTHERLRMMAVRRPRSSRRPLPTMAPPPVSVPINDNRAVEMAPPPPPPVAEVSRPSMDETGAASPVVLSHRTTHRVRTYRAGKLTYDLPDSLRVNQTYKAFLTISSTLAQADIRRLIDQRMNKLRITHQNRIRNDGDVALPVEGVVQASLTCVSGNADNLRVTPLVSPSRTLDTTDFTTYNWTWNVMALQPGTYELALRVAVGRAGQASLDEIVLDQTVVVEAIPLPRGKMIIHQAEIALTGINLLWDNWGKGLTGLILTAIVTFFREEIIALWKRRKNATPTEPQPGDQPKIG